MSQTWFFMTPSQLFEMLRDLQRHHAFFVTLRRFEPPGGPGPAGFEVVSLSADLGSHYVEGGFSEIYLTRTEVPRIVQDWHFVEAVAPELLTIEGGRTDGNVLEQWTARVHTRPSRAMPLYRALQRTLRKTCNRGLLVRGSLYSNIHYHPDVAAMTLVTSLGPDGCECRPRQP